MMLKKHVAIYMEIHNLFVYLVHNAGGALNCEITSGTRFQHLYFYVNSKNKLFSTLQKLSEFKIKSLMLLRLRCEGAQYQLT